MNIIKVEGLPKSDNEFYDAVRAILQIKGADRRAKVLAIRSLVTFTAGLAQFEVYGKNYVDKTASIQDPIDHQPTADKIWRLIWL